MFNAGVTGNRRDTVARTIIKVPRFPSGVPDFEAKLTVVGNRHRFNLYRLGSRQVWAYLDERSNRTDGRNVCLLGLSIETVCLDLRMAFCVCRYLTAV